MYLFVGNCVILVLRPTPPSFIKGTRVAAPSVCFAAARILLAAAPTAPPCFRHWRRSSPLPLVGEPLAKRESFAECQSLPYKGRWHEVPERLDEGGPEEYFCAFWLAKKRSSE